MKFSLRLKTHDSVMKLIITVMALVGILILIDVIIIMNIMHEDKPITKENRLVKGNDFITHSKLNASKNNIFILK